MDEAGGEAMLQQMIKTKPESKKTIQMKSFTIIFGVISDNTSYKLSKFKTIGYDIFI